MTSSPGTDPELADLLAKSKELARLSVAATRWADELAQRVVAIRLKQEERIRRECARAWPRRRPAEPDA